MKMLWTVIALLSLVGHSYAADIEAGKKTAVVCAACHGENGISTRADVPNLAGQKAKYITNQLNAFRDGKRKNPFMNAIAPQLSDADMENVAAYFSSLPGGEASAMSPIPPSMTQTKIQFPADYKQSFTHYTTINFPKRKQVRHYYANPAAIQAASQGKPVADGAVLFVEIFKAKLDADGKPALGTDGFFVKDKLAAYTAMEHQKGWGDQFPEMLRNDGWHYAVFKADQTFKAGVN